MDLIVNQMMELEIVHIADGHTVVEKLAGSPVIKPGLAVVVESGLGKRIADIVLLGAVKHRGHHLDAQLCGGTPEVDLKHLSDIHTGRDAQRVQNNIERAAPGQVGHILLREHAGDDTLVAMASGHLIADRDLSLLRDVAADNHVDAG